jgi:hypothetical protein
MNTIDTTLPSLPTRSSVLFAFCNRCGCQIDKVIDGIPKAHWHRLSCDACKRESRRRALNKYYLRSRLEKAEARREAARKHYHKTRDKRLIQQKSWKLLNPDKYKQGQKRWRDTPAYAAVLLRKNTVLKSSEIPEDLKEVKIILIKLNRQLKRQTTP